jgi:hypothetical protein
MRLAGPLGSRGVILPWSASELPATTATATATVTAARAEMPWPAGLLACWQDRQQDAPVGFPGSVGDLVAYRVPSERGGNGLLTAENRCDRGAVDASGTVRMESVLEAVRRTDWCAIPGSDVLFVPEVIAPALRALASASSEDEGFAAVRPLANGGLRHDHSGILHPAAVVAAPMLLDIAELSSDAVLPAIEALLQALLRDSCPWSDAPYTVGSAGEERLLCCAIADTVRAHSRMLMSRGQRGLRLVHAANAHWSFTVVEVSEAERAGNVLALGDLIGAPEGRYARCELRRPHSRALQLSARVNVLHPPDGHGGEALLHFHGVEPDQLRVGDVLASPCHDCWF